MPVITVPCLMDNYAYLVVCERTGRVAIVDPSEPEPVIAALDRLAAERPIQVEAILATHHHHDHVGGNEALVKHFADRGTTLRVHGSEHDAQAQRIPAQTDALAEGAEVRVGELRARVWHIPGHTLGALAYDFGPDVGVFTGDTLFLAGCGRLFEGTPAMMHASLSKLVDKVEPATPVYPGHEYTEKNLEFALSLEPGSPVLEERRDRVAAQRRQSQPSVGARFEEELRSNPFIRVSEPALVEAARRADPACDGTPVAVLGTLRALKDRF